MKFECEICHLKVLSFDILMDFVIRNQITAKFVFASIPLSYEMIGNVIIKNFCHSNVSLVFKLS